MTTKPKTRKAPAADPIFALIEKQHAALIELKVFLKAAVDDRGRSEEFEASLNGQLDELEAMLANNVNHPDIRRHITAIYDLLNLRCEMRREVHLPRMRRQKRPNLADFDVPWGNA
jgi:hypothetical protein